MNARRSGALIACCVLVACGDAPSGLAPVNPAHPERLPGDLVQPLEKQIERVRAACEDPLEHATLGLMYEANKFWIEARECYERAAQIDPEEVLWALHAGMCALESGDVDGAREIYSAAARRFADFAPLQQRWAEFLLEAGPFDAARAAFERTLELKPGEPHGYVGLGDVLLREGRHADAIEPLRRAIEIAPDYKLAHWLLGLAYRGIGLRRDAERELLAGRDAGRRFLADAWSLRTRQFVAGLEAGFEHAMALLEAGNLPQAAAVLERVNRLYPGDLRTMVNLGVARARLADYGGSLAILSAAIELDPRAPLAYVNRASTLMALGRLSEALQDADRAVSVAPGLADAHFLRGGVLAAMGEIEPGLQELRAAQRLDPNNPAIRDRILALEHP